jgi:peptide/nickel transport system substrate-binding protein
MSEQLDYWKKRYASHKIGRREFMGRVTALGVTTALASTMASSIANASPQRGGTLRIGEGGGSSTDSMDPITAPDSVPAEQNFMTYSYMTKVNENSEVVPDLAESWEASDDAKTWVFNLRQGVEFHNGKTVDAEDVIYSIKRNYGPDSTSGASGLLATLEDIKADGPNKVVMSFSGGNADVPFIVSDYHIGIVPKDFTDWANPVGSGPYKIVSYEPGVKSTHEHFANYWDSNSAWYDGVELTVINDGAARVSALAAGQVDCINRIDRKTIGLVKDAPGFVVVQSNGAQHYTMVMDTKEGPVGDNNIRQALKYAIDREQCLELILQGYGSIGNDHPVPSYDPMFDATQEVKQFDPEKVKFYLNKAGISELTVDLSTSEAAFGEAVDYSVVFSEQAKKAGINVNVVREAGDGYWSDVWMKKPFLMSYWGGRPTADLMYSVAWAQGAAWNDSRFEHARFNELLVAGRAELDQAKRKAIYAEIQRIASDEGGNLIALFAAYLDGYSDKIAGVVPNPIYELHGHQVASRTWFAS